jgi:hypothetical protein
MKPSWDVNDKENKPRNHGGNTKFLQTATDQDPRDVQHKPIVANDPEVPFSTTITGTLGDPPQRNQIRNNQERTKVRQEMERTARTPLTRAHRETL